MRKSLGAWRYLPQRRHLNFLAMRNSLRAIGFKHAGQTPGGTSIKLAVSVISRSFGDCWEDSFAPLTLEFAVGFAFAHATGAGDLLEGILFI
jgi:hypothetical protein